MEWLKNLHPTTKLLLLTGAGVSASCICYSVYRQNYPLEHDDEVEKIVLPSSKQLEGASNAEIPEENYLETLNSEHSRLNVLSKDELNESGWVTPTASNGNLVCRLVENADERFEGDSPRAHEATENEIVIDDFEVDRKVFISCMTTLY